MHKHVLLQAGYESCRRSLVTYNCAEGISFELHARFPAASVSRPVNIDAVHQEIRRFQGHAHGRRHLSQSWASVVFEPSERVLETGTCSANCH